VEHQEVRELAEVLVRQVHRELVEVQDHQVQVVPQVVQELAVHQELVEVQEHQEVQVQVVLELVEVQDQVDHLEVRQYV
jgi:hypothetical protein